jgi:nitrite reductase/ring-hydroxylating ferredoxin subunit
MEWIKIFSDEQEAFQRLSPDKPQLLILNGVRICLVLHQQSFYAIQDSCTHNGESLSKGHVNYMGEIICPWHNYCFSTETGREVGGRSADLKTYPVKIEASGFYVGLP